MPTSAGSASPGHAPDVTTPGLYLDGIPYDRFNEMRAAPGLVWHPYEQGGFWAVTRYGDVREVSRNPGVFSSGIGHTNLWDLEADALAARRSIIDTDAPEHTRLRRLVSRQFTPRSIKGFTEATRQIAVELLDRFVDSGGGDWVHQVAAPLPIRVIMLILGVPGADAEYLVELSDYLVEGTGDRPTLAPDAFGNTTPLRLLPFGSPASHALYVYGEDLGERRRATPAEDLVTELVRAADSGALSPQEYRNFFHLLVFAGNETTRTALVHGALAFAEQPDQLRRLHEHPELLDTAVEEVLRWATPVMHMRRTARRDTTLAGTGIAAGDKVVMWYASANRDPEVFGDPFDFDVGRAPNDHFAFGGGGHHFCLGASLARMEIMVLVQELLRRRIGLRQAGEPQRIASNFVHGVASVAMEPVEMEP
ncbi:MAG: cytochrome P450 [bacterium]|nr:cytochrome P450 [bacterium]